MEKTQGHEAAMTPKEKDENEATIWKFSLYLESDEQTVEMPKNAQILACHDQNGIPVIWAAVYPGNEKELRKFIIRGTGHPLDPEGRYFHLDMYERPVYHKECLKYIGTTYSGPFVWHIFEVLEVTGVKNFMDSKNLSTNAWIINV